MLASSTHGQILPCRVVFNQSLHPTFIITGTRDSAAPVTPLGRTSTVLDGGLTDPSDGSVGLAFHWSEHMTSRLARSAKSCSNKGLGAGQACSVAFLGTALLSQGEGVAHCRCVQDPFAVAVAISVREDLFDGTGAKFAGYSTRSMGGNDLVDGTTTCDIQRRLSIVNWVWKVMRLFE